MITLYESLLGDTKTKITQAKHTIGAFGSTYEIFSFSIFVSGLEFVEKGYVKLKQLEKEIANKSFINIQKTQSYKTVTYCMDNGSQFEVGHKPNFEVILKILMFIENLKCMQFRSPKEMSVFLEDALNTISKKKIIVTTFTMAGNIHFNIRHKSYRDYQLFSITLDKAETENNFVKESLLNRTKNKVSTASTTLKELNLLKGWYDVIDLSQGMKSANALGTLKLNKLNQLNDGKFLSAEAMKHTLKFDDERMGAVVRYIENVDITELGFPALDVHNVMEMYKFVDALEKKMKEDGVFNKPDAVRVSCIQNMNERSNGVFHILIYRKNKGGSGMSIDLKRKTNV